MAVDVLSVLGNAIGTVKKLQELSAKIKNAELQGLVADLRLQIADIKAEAAQLKQEDN